MSGVATSPARTSVVRAPSASAIGPVTANEIGSRLTETNQSKLVTRPSRSVGTRRCMSVVQAMMAAVKPAAPIALVSISCQSSVASP